MLRMMNEKCNDGVEFMPLTYVETLTQLLIL